EDGISLRDAMDRFGYNPDKAHEAIRDDIKAYLEVHIEQGPVLNTNNKKIGIVEKVTGLNVLEVSVKGREDHAGTTPMNLRKDALVGASKVIYEIPKIVSRISGTGTATVGMMKVLPGSSNVVPKEVRFSIDIRDIVPEKIKEITKKVKEEIKSLKEYDLEIEIRTEAEEVPVKLDEELAKISEKSVRNLNIPYLRMNSGAGHDAQIFAEKFPSGLIFIPCKDGRSHTPEEFATTEDIALAVETVVEIIKNLAY
ncbi:MAG: hydantoinase/carbamoylase family amidase, partial [Bacillota bacterium]|nr:hydantoinase/carbamoylase family amidase [Bacillota bacterium]